MQKRKSSALSGSEAKQQQRPAAPTASSGRAACPIAAGGRATNPMTASGPAAMATAPLRVAAAQWDPLLLQYRVIKSCPLGSGADGGVVRGQVRQGPNSGEWHALKYISRDAYHQSRERDTLIHLQAAPHPNIVLLISTFDPFPSTRPQWVLAFPEADMDCQAFLARHRRVMTPKIADRMASQILAGIQHLHDICSIVHRDLKPANILVFLEPAAEECTPSASLGAVGGSFAMNVRLKIADFSRARFVAPRSGMVQEKLATAVLTMMSTGVCTRNFCAPELLWHGREEPDSEDQVLCDTSIDVWSFGCICFEFHSGQNFASGTTLVEIAAQLHLRLGGWPPQLLPDDVKDEVVRVAGNLLAQSSMLLQEHPWLAHSLCWLPTQRLAAHELSKLIPISAAVGLVASAMPSGRDSPHAALAAPRDPRQELTATPFLSPMATPEPRFMSMPCKCSGNCSRSSHRAGCSNQQVHESSRLCIDCVCQTPRCGRPAFRSIFCRVHARVFQNMPWTLQITARMGCELSQELLPVNVTDFLMHARSMKEDLASVITLAMFKEPSATAAFMRTCQPRMSDPSISPQEVAGELISVLRQVEQSDTELEVLGAQGVARCTGLASTCRAYFRIIARAPHSDPKKTKKKKMGQQISNKQPAKMRSTGKNKNQKAGRPGKRPKIAAGKSQKHRKEHRKTKLSPVASQERIILGKCRIEYLPTDEIDSIARFLAACRAQQGAWQSLWEMKEVQQVIAAVCQVTQSMHDEAKIFPSKVGYVRKFIDRKLFLLVLAAGSVHSDGWQSTAASALNSTLPDQHDFTSGFPDGWTAAEMSNFLFGRDDWAVFASMWACLWHDVQEKYAAKLEHIEGFLVGGMSSCFAKRARALAIQLGHNVTPRMIIDDLIRFPNTSSPNGASLNAP